VRLFVREDAGGRSVSALVALPPDRVSNDLRLRLEQLLMARLGGLSVDHHLSADSDPAWYLFIVHVPEGEIPPFDAPALEAEVVDAARGWDDRLADALVKEFGARQGRELARRYGARFPGYYKSAQAIYQAVFDIRHMEQLGPEQPIVVGLQNERDVGEPLTRLKLYKTGGKAPLTDLLPLLEQLGLTVVEEVPTRLQGGVGDDGRYIHDFGVLGPDGLPLEVDQLESLVAATVVAVWNGRAGSDWLNRLVVAGGLAWRQVTILRAYREYRQLLGAQFTSRYQNDCLVRNHDIARLLVELFECRFEPTRDDQDERADEIEERILQQLDSVSSLDDDRILRGYLGLIQATVRTNAFRRAEGDQVAFKFRCADVPGMPLPVPMWEIFVYSTAMAGVHLRGGMVARGGIRWSDRLEDYRTEILGLMKAQMVKNAVIVPVGAKGGFIVKNPPVDRGELLEEERLQYMTLMRGLLDLTDNIVGGEIRHPPDVRVLDGDDAYLVVAADKGTAHLSDTANEVAAEYGFWLGDAFASGGSAGYDHKALGITAKGGWESVKRHFREMGRDVMSQPFTAVGIGDMSGDVFGNGMLLSPHLRLIAAFDHRHIFIDPNPDAASSLAERRRLFDKAGSSWDDYDRALISDGGGVWPRTAKAVPMAPQARVALGTEAEKLTPTELIQTILRAPVDLLWNGGIGTYVKASAESQADAGDRANDAVRVDGIDLRAVVVGEGGNLGFTQLGRIEYAAGGGRINTDAIDNSAGVDCSDHEVNLKILLALAVERGELTTEGRDKLLQEVAPDVVAHVLYDNYLQVQILSQETAVSARRMEAYEDLMLELEQAAVLKRRLEFLPGSEQMAERLAAGHGMVRPELCVLLAYAKRLLRDQVLDSSLPDDPYLQEVMREYFPPAVVERFGALMPHHPLRRELIATMVTNDVVNSMGMTFVQRMTAETGCAPDEVCRCFLAARDVSNARDHWDDVERLDGVVAPDVQSRLMDGVDSMVEELARWYLRNNPGLDLATEISATRDRFSELVGGMHDAATIAWRTAYDTRLQDALGQGVPETAARFGAGVPDLVFALDILAVAGASGRSIGEIAHAFFAVGERLFLDVIEHRVNAIPAENRWQRLAWSSMLDDLRLLRRQIVSSVIAESAGAPIDDAVEAYLANRADPYQRLARLMETAGPTGVDDASLIMVLVHQLRQVVA
jgi:glutamate dehydrogenase